ncbi:hypothetical protein MSAN_00111100 [Mycena sanguinolenta]|uniref:Uncharacterized protein n=1 Tax=Mycena sanguinolenta TaxID=230812 RepID=A0A8H7DLP4_9AGAR|nr:hypothetical protein MSAN_00111100 [Mycena sanguinolenta]
MSQSGNSSFSSSRLSIFGSPRPAPPAPSPSDDIQGFVVPVIPPPDCPLHMVATPDGLHLPRVSANAHPPTHRRVQRLITFRVNPGGQAGIPCPPCAVLGIPDCRFADPDDFLYHLKRRRDAVFRDERTALVNAVHDNHLPASLFAWEYGRATAHFYSAAQGAIDRFIINYNATHPFAAVTAHSPMPPPMPGFFPALWHSVPRLSPLVRILPNNVFSIPPSSFPPLTKPLSTAFIVPSVLPGMKILLIRKPSLLPLARPCFNSAHLSLPSHRTMTSANASSPSNTKSILTILGSASHLATSSTRSMRSRPTPSPNVKNSRDRKAEQGERLRAAAGVAARAERRAAPRHRSPGPPDLVSIPSSDEESEVEEPAPPSSRPQGNDTIAPVPRVPLSPLPELEGLLLNLSFSAPLSVPIASPLSPTLSLPDHVLRHALRPSGLNPITREKALPPTVPASDAVPVLPSLPALVLPAKPVAPVPIRRLPFGPAHAVRSSSGSSIRSKRRAVNPRKLKPGAQVVKRCYHCTAASHLVAECPLRYIN